MKITHQPLILARSLVAIVFLAGCAGAPQESETPAEAPEVRLNIAPDERTFGTVEVVNLDARQLADLEGRNLTTAEDWKAVFAVYTGEAPSAAGEDKPPVAGSYAFEDGLIRFRPRFPFVGGLAYHARFAFAPEDAPLVASFALPRRQTTPTAFVTAIYPTASEVPENLLRLYVHFSAPMSRGEAYERVRIVDEASGAAVEMPFVEITEELWDPETQRLTLLFDPGRIKRGLRPHMEAGLPLLAGGSYRLVVSADWRDAQDVALKEGFEKRFKVLAADRISPDPDTWRLDAPSAGSRESVELHFPEPLDHGLLMRVLRVRGPQGDHVQGEVGTNDSEKRWTFTPSQPWRSGAYGIEVETILEDLAGNNLKNVFDVDLQNPSARTTDEENVVLPFTVAEGS